MVAMFIEFALWACDFDVISNWRVGAYQYIDFEIAYPDTYNAWMKVRSAKIEGQNF